MYTLYREQYVTAMLAKEMHSSVDEQKLGPYTFWYHYHQIDAEEGRIKFFYISQSYFMAYALQNFNI
jgi:hypothetical protein